MTLFKNKYRIESTRLANYNYSQSGMYFITICCKNREHYFGEIVDLEMRLNKIGKIVETEWLQTPKIRLDMNLLLDEFVIMPNHFHAILIIGENEYNKTMQRRDAMHCVSTDNATNKRNKFGPQSKNLSSIVRGFKSSVTINTRETNSAFAWQSRYHEHIIKDSFDLNRIQNYITTNPQHWKDDCFNETNTFLGQII